MPESIYLDHNSTSPMSAKVIQTMVDTFQAGYVNPASQHRPGQLARRKLEQYRREILEMLGGRTGDMRSDELIFTSGGTESDNLALFGLAPLGRLLWQQSNEPTEQPFRVIVSTIEHPAVQSAAQHLKRMGYEICSLPVDQNGVCLTDALPEMLSQGPVALVSVMMANNETGAIQPIRQLAEICRQHEVLFHTDAVQAVGKIDVNFSELAVDALSFTGHKLAGPRGIGGLVLRHGILPEPILFGGFQQKAVRPGTEDIALVAGLWQALKDFCAAPQVRQQHLLNLRDTLEQKLTRGIPGLIVNSVGAIRTPQTLNVAFPELPRQNFLMAADLAGIAVSTGSACASGSSDPSPVLEAMGLPKSTIDNSIRISVGYSNTAEEIEEAFLRIRKIVQRS